MDAYEIRYNILVLAKDIVATQVDNRNEKLRMDHEINRQRWAEQGCGGNVPEYPQLNKYNVSDIIQVADELKQFISKKQDH